MKTKMKLIKAENRGFANHGWLKSYHSFSFAGYYHPDHIHFGALRVLNDDRVNASMGFSKHPHDNMEIISIPLYGDLEHKDSMGNTTVIRQHDVQIMSAGTGIMHSEFNRNKDKEVHFLQIWVFPKKRNIVPAYDQKTFKPEDRKNKLQLIVDPEGKEGVKINQDAWFLMGNFDSGKSAEYNMKGKDSGLYVFVLEGSFEILGQKLEKRDALAIEALDTVKIEALSPNAEILIMEVPMSGF